METQDQGATWREIGVIATDPDRSVDIGDGNIVKGPGGRLYATYRHNHHGRTDSSPDYAIKVAVSTDRGQTWKPHSVVATSKPSGPGPSRGLWSPFLLTTQKGELQCYYDDEATPFDRGFKGHQWLSMRALASDGKTWGPVVTVARAHDPKVLSRDGMANVLDLGGGRLFCAFESVQAEAPHAGLIRYVTSRDGGKSWSWSSEERKVLYEPKDRRYHAFAPALARLKGGALLAVFASNEGRPEPGISGTPPRELNLDIRFVTSDDRGATWSASHDLYSGGHHCYLPGIVTLGSKGEKALVSFLDYDRGCQSMLGEVKR